MKNNKIGLYCFEIFSTNFTTSLTYNNTFHKILRNKIGVKYNIHGI
ncbi:hypothetical protein HMPREF9999_01013 [Alloprevotella sp. oral taxon 473 str. F0040]|nr:hypothetical protein HMPREF9999_01013 [Alloprevotella sp. oral taxon 473 str. F0040]